jgi:hypothetical protein
MRDVEEAATHATPAERRTLALFALAGFSSTTTPSATPPATRSCSARALTSTPRSRATGARTAWAATSSACCSITTPDPTTGSWSRR